MNILHVASGDLWAGAEVQLFHLANALDNIEEINLFVALLNHGQLEAKLIEKGIKVMVFDETQLSPLQIFRKLKAFSIQVKPNIIHSHRIKENILSGLVAKFVGCKNIRTVHGDTETRKTGFSLRANFLFFLDKFFSRYFQHKIIAVSDELASKLTQRYQLDKITTINNSINIDYVVQKSKEVINFNFQSEKIKIGFIGRFVPVKRVELFYEIAKQVVLANDKIDFYMLGDGPLFDEIKSTTERDKLSHRIHLLGFVENSAPYLKQLDYLMFTSKHEGLPMTLLEAMALETAIISTDLTTIKSILRGNECGYFFENEQPRDMANYINQLTQDKALTCKKVQAAKNILEQNYSLKINLNKYIDVYRQALGF